MKIVILDAYTQNPGDNPWDPIAALGELTVYDRTPKEEILARSRDAEILITNKTPLRAETLAELPKLRCIGVLATGYDVVDIAEAGRRGIPVINVVNYGATGVAQHAMALLLELCHRPSLHDAAVREGRWSACPDFCFWLTQQIELTGRTMGIVGLGTIGRKVAALANAFGMHVAAASVRKGGAELAREAEKGEPLPFPVDYLDLDELLACSDVVSLHCPLSDQSRHLINAERLARMKKGAFLLNLARGPLLDEAAVADALRSGQLGGLGADVVSTEPISMDNPLLSAPNTILTPHIAWAGLRSRQNITRILADNLSAWLAGTPKSVVNTAWLAK